MYDRIANAVVAAHAGALERNGAGVVGGSGSLCLAFAAVVARRPFELIAVCPASTLIEHRVQLEKHRLTVVLSDAAAGLYGAHDRAVDEAGRRGAVLLATPKESAHAARAFEATLGRELSSQIESGGAEPPAVLVAPLGSGALLFGVARALEAAGARPKLVGTVARGAGRTLQDGVRHAASSSPPPAGLEQVAVSDEEAFEARIELARSEGLLVGLASAAALGVAKLHARAEPGRAVWAIIVDAGDRYFSVDHLLRSSRRAGSAVG